MPDSNHVWIGTEFDPKADNTCLTHPKFDTGTHSLTPLIRQVLSSAFPSPEASAH